MTTRTVDDPAQELDTVIRNTPGVTALYRSSGLLGQVIAEGRRALAVEAYARVTESGGKLAVTVTIGTGGDSAVDTCRAVHDTITTWMHKHGHPNTAITVTIAHVTA
ncbi:MAG TPA: hypothetical protein VGC45_00985 [Gryllotalpicola sp.]